MLSKLKTIALATLVLASASATCAATESQAVNSTATEAKDAEYARKLDDRVSKIVATLALNDEAKAARVHALIVAQYRTLNVWHETHDAHLKELKKSASGTDAEKSAAAKADIEAIGSSLKAIHNNYLAVLANELTPELIERVKDGMTVGKVQFTYNGYVQQYPTLTEEQKAKVLELLKAAREEAMDAGSMDEKSDIFNRYKGRINNWLSKQGVDQAKGKKPKADKKVSPEM
jgi:Spy/CpxP family protein refolding chaperone